VERAPGRSRRWSNRAASVTAALETSSPAAGTLERSTNLGDCCSRKARSIQHRSNVARPRRTPRRHGCSLSHVHTCTSRERCSLAGATMPSCSRHSTQTTYTHPRTLSSSWFHSRQSCRTGALTPIGKSEIRLLSKAGTRRLLRRRLWRHQLAFANGSCRAEFAMGWALLQRDKATAGRKPTSATPERSRAADARRGPRGEVTAPPIASIHARACPPTTDGRTQGRLVTRQC
jgi:hypothetical protein